MNRIPDAELSKLWKRCALPRLRITLACGEVEALLTALRQAYEEIDGLEACTPTLPTTLPSVTTTNADEWICPTCWGVIVPGVPHSCAGGEP